jgi:glutamate-1-semialdehyde 2,1-aminomutase
MNTKKSEIAFKEAKNLIPGGVNSPVRSFNAVKSSPLFISKGEGSYIYDIDDNKYIDFVQSWGPMILGHGDLDVQRVTIDAIKNSFGFGAPTLIESELAKEILEIYSFADKIRFVSSGTEATMSAIRLARGYTNKNDIIKFKGCYHGHSDALLVEAGSGAATFGKPSSLGVPEDFTKHTLLADYNDISSVEKCFKDSDNIACIIIEPVAGNMGLVPASLEFLKSLREICDKHNTLLIFDEVMSGFRVSIDKNNPYFAVTPDIVTLGKVIGGGLPVGAFMAKKHIIDLLSPDGGIYQAGTLSGNPIAMNAGYATIKKIKEINPYDRFSKLANQFMDGFTSIAKSYDIGLQTTVRGSMFGFFFSDEKIINFKDTEKIDKELFSLFHYEMLKNGVYLACSAYESGFICNTMDEDVINNALDAVEKSIKTITK